jgi:5,5'-dehydrodivanillate O-demethylase
MLSKQENERFTRVGPGTPVGELMRRYWHPIAAAAELTRHPTKFVKILGEELVLFKDGRGKLGLIDAYCAHRRANLVYGIPEQDGLRCPYHGWKYDCEGRCLEQPFEETVRCGGTFKDKIKLASYSVHSLGGFIFAYLGPQPAPLLPRWDLLIEENVWREIGYAVTACNWLQTVENILDPVHVEWLHGVFRNYAAERTGKIDNRRKRIRHLKVAFDLAEYGIIKRRILEGETEEADDWKIGHWLVFPSTQKGPDMLRFRVPVDDEQTAQWYFSVHPLGEGELRPTMKFHSMTCRRRRWTGMGSRSSNISTTKSIRRTTRFLPRSNGWLTVRARCWASRTTASSPIDIFWKNRFNSSPRAKIR